MKNCFVVLGLFLLLLVGAPKAFSSDSIDVYLLTCSPGNEIYEYYGHSAIRIKDWKENVDLVFNFGVFSFDSPNFRWRFLRGKTDYLLDAVPFSLFKREYMERGSYIVEQHIALEENEKKTLIKNLCQLLSIRGWSYRYNFLYDNCTVRVRDQIEAAINGKILYVSAERRNTFRSIIHFFARQHPWEKLGQDLLLGAAADKVITEREKQFAPLILMHSLESAKIQRSDTQERPLLMGTRTYFPNQAIMSARPGAWKISPRVAFLALFILSIGMLIWQARRRTVFIAYELVLMLLQGLTGGLVFLLFFFSEHPTVNTNFLIWVLNPIPLLFIPFRWRNIVRGQRDLYPACMSIVIGSFLLFSPILPQRFPLEVMIFLLILLMQNLYGVYFSYHHAS